MDIAGVAAFTALILALAALVVGAGVAARTAELQKEIQTLRLARPAHGLSTGAAVPDLVAKDVDDNSVDWHRVRHGPTVLIAASTECRPCTELTRQIPAFRARNPDWLAVIVAQGDRVRIRDQYKGLEALVLRLDDLPAPELFRTIATPHVFVLRDGYVRHQGGANTVDQLESMTRRTQVEPAPRVATSAD